MDMEQFIEELRAFCERSGKRIVFRNTGVIGEYTANESWIADHVVKSLAALIRDGAGDRIHKELFEACEAPIVSASENRMQKAVEASKEYFVREKRERDAKDNL